jgi:hypothetical protein
MQEKGRIPWGYIVPALIILAVIVGVVYVQVRAGTTTTDILPPRASQDYTGTLGQGFACVTTSLYLHIHPWLRIIINGKNVTIPSGIGITNPGDDGTVNGEPLFGGNSAGTTCYEPIHTHDDSGLIHIEAATNTNFTLGEFFTEWGLTYQYAVVNGVHEPIIFNQTDVLGYKLISSSTSLTLLVDGKSPPAGDFNGSSSNYNNLVLNILDYCSSSLPANSAPCYPTDAGTNGEIGPPLWNGVTGFAPAVSGGYPYGGNHTIVLEYTS